MHIYTIPTDFLLQNSFALPKPETIHVFLFSIKDSALLSQDISALPQAEHQRADTLHIEQDRLRFLVSRTLLRKILSCYLSCPAKDLHFKKGLHGKPYLSDSNQHTPQIHFNISHSGNYIALAFSCTSPVGIDIEQIRKNIRAQALVRRFFHPDELCLFEQLPESEKLPFLFSRWTVREAFLKGLGTGLSVSPSSFFVEKVFVPKNQCSSQNGQEDFFYNIKKSQEDYSSWQIRPIASPAGYYCSVAFQAP